MVNLRYKNFKTMHLWLTSFSLLAFKPSSILFVEAVYYEMHSELQRISHLDYLVRSNCNNEMSLENLNKFVIITFWGYLFGTTIWPIIKLKSNWFTKKLKHSTDCIFVFKILKLFIYFKYTLLSFFSFYSYAITVNFIKCYQQIEELQSLSSSSLTSLDFQQ